MKILALTEPETKRAVGMAVVDHFGVAPVEVTLHRGGRVGGPAFHVRFALPVDRHRGSIDCLQHESCRDRSHGVCTGVCTVVFGRALEPLVLGPEGSFETVNLIENGPGDVIGIAIVYDEERFPEPDRPRVWTAVVPTGHPAGPIQATRVLAPAALNSQSVEVTLRRLLHRLGTAGDSHARRLSQSIDAQPTLVLVPLPPGTGVYPWQDPPEVDYDLTRTTIARAA